MKHAHKVSDVSQISEMEIVDTFTKLIFGEEGHYCKQELLIIQALRMVDTNVMFDSHQGLGEYLRALGVGEMIDLVRQVEQQMREQMPALLDYAANNAASGGRLNPRAH